MQGRILCVTPGNKHTFPGKDGHWGAEPYENSRRYYMAAPGQLLYWGERDHEPIVRPYRAHPNLGICVIEDFFYQVDEPMARKATMVDRHSLGHIRAADLAAKWSKYGAVLMKGAVPTDAEVIAAKEVRRRYGLWRINRAQFGYKQAQAGRPGYHINYDRSDEEWALEIGVALPDTVGAMTKIADNSAFGKGVSEPAGYTVPCPACAEPIRPEATKCRFCQERFTAPVSQIAAEKAAAIGEQSVSEEEQQILDEAEQLDSLIPEPGLEKENPLNEFDVPEIVGK